MTILKEGGNIFAGTAEFDQKIIPAMMKEINKVLKQTGAKAFPIGSGATPTNGKMSGDLDMVVDAGTLIKHFKIEPTDKKAMQKVKVELENFFKASGFETKKSGTIVHVKTNVGEGEQVDIMVVADGETAAKFHVHDLPKGSPYKGVHKQIVIADLAKTTTTAEHTEGFKWSPYKGLVSRATDELVSNNLDEMAKILLNPNAKAKDLGSVESIVAAKPEAQAIVDKNEEYPDSNWNKTKIQVAAEEYVESLADKQLRRIKELLA